MGCQSAENQSILQIFEKRDQPKDNSVQSFKNRNTPQQQTRFQTKQKQFSTIKNIQSQHFQNQGAIPKQYN